MDLKPGHAGFAPHAPHAPGDRRKQCRLFARHAQNGRLVAGTGAGHEASRPLHTTRTRATGVAAGESTRGAAGPASRQDLARATLRLRPHVHVPVQHPAPGQAPPERTQMVDGRALPLCLHGHRQVVRAPPRRRHWQIPHTIFLRADYRYWAGRLQSPIPPARYARAQVRRQEGLRLHHPCARPPLKKTPCRAPGPRADLTTRAVQT